ncbi:hypothetical protein ACJJIU_22315 (plasmid) [Microbulbifer sp. CnH-101-E]|uniref:hypothetical protein n=1 Tax=unclassified Microbulbifer TaxID=2619833 RepID=UPI004039A5C0
MVVSDQYIESLFEGAVFGPAVDDSAAGKRLQIAKTLRNQIDGYWSGHTAYHIVVSGGFLHDAKASEPKKLTALGAAFLQEMGGR